MDPWVQCSQKWDEQGGKRGHSEYRRGPGEGGAASPALPPAMEAGLGLAALSRGLI